jgi:hypothetical protein
MAITIEQAMAETESGNAIGDLGQAYNPERNFRLEPHSSETWWVSLAGIEAVITADSKVRSEWKTRLQKVRIRVTRGDGKTKRTRRWIRLGPAAD